MGSLEPLPSETFTQKSLEGKEGKEEEELSEEKETLAQAPAPTTNRGKCVRFGGEQKMADPSSPAANIIQNLAPHLPGMDPNSVYIVSGPFTYFDPQQNSYTGMLVAQPVPQGASVVAVPCGAPPSPSAGDTYPGKPCPLPTAWTHHDGKPFRNIQANQQFNGVQMAGASPAQYQVVPQQHGGGNLPMNASPPVTTTQQVLNPTTTHQQSPYPQQVPAPVASSSQAPGVLPPSQPTISSQHQAVSNGTQYQASSNGTHHHVPSNGIHVANNGTQHQPVNGTQLQAATNGTQHQSASNGTQHQPVNGTQHQAVPNGIQGHLNGMHQTVSKLGANGIAGLQNQMENVMSGLQQQAANVLTGPQHHTANNQQKMFLMNQQPMNGQQMLINGLQPQGRKSHFSSSANHPDPQYQPAPQHLLEQAKPNDSPPPTSYSAPQPAYRRQNLQVVNNNNHIINNNSKPTPNNKPKPAPAWRNSQQQPNYLPNLSHPHQFQNGQFLPPGAPGQTHVVTGPSMAPVNGHYAMNGHFPVMNGFSNHIQQVNGLSGQPVNMPQVSLAQNCMSAPQAQVPPPQNQANLQPGYGATLHMGGGQFATGSQAMRIPVSNLGGGCPIHQPNMPLGGTPHIMHWDANHPSGHPVPLRQPNPPVYYNVPAPAGAGQGGNNLQTQQQVQDCGSGSQSPSSDMSAQTGSGGSDASSEDSVPVDVNRQQQPVQYVQGGYSNGYPVQCVVHYGSPAPPAKEVYDIHGRKIQNFEQHFANRNMQVH